MVGLLLGGFATFTRPNLQLLHYFKGYQVGSIIFLISEMLLREKILWILLVPRLIMLLKKIFGSEESKEILIGFLNGIIYDGKKLLSF